MGNGSAVMSETAKILDPRKFNPTKVEAYTVGEFIAMLWKHNNVDLLKVNSIPQINDSIHTSPLWSGFKVRRSYEEHIKSVIYVAVKVGFEDMYDHSMQGFHRLIQITRGYAH